MNAYLTVERQGGLLQVSLKDDWVFDNLNVLQETLDKIEPETGTQVKFSCGGLQNFDLAGAWVLYERSMDFEEVGIETDFEGFQEMVPVIVAVINPSVMNSSDLSQRIIVLTAPRRPPPGRRKFR